MRLHDDHLDMEAWINVHDNWRYLEEWRNRLGYFLENMDIMYNI